MTPRAGPRNHLKLAGSLLLAGTAQFVPLMSVAQSVYPNYDVSTQPISDLGATCVTTEGVTSCRIVEPSAEIFNSSVFLLGLLVLAGAILLYHSGRRAVGVAGVLSAVGAIGVGTFPETAGVVHTLFSLLLFLFAGLAAVVVLLQAGPPFSYLSGALGVTTLVALVLYASGTYLGLGQGGMERMIAYPALVWGSAYGAYLIGQG